MPDSVFIALTFASAIGAGLMAGVYFAFSAMVMPGLRRLEPADATRAMQAINVALMNAWFLAVFMGSAAFSLLSVVLSFVRWGNDEAVYLLVAGLLFLGGSLGLTAGYHIPRNNALLALDADGPEVPEVWRRFDSEWTSWNHVRAVASLAATILFIAGIAAA
ncbi:DUF1772 domain-containing protein [Jiangella asiatica]|uniref:DUF1772 domain-containing protein n=1 Tax=Jiangella asiatica TaxID=2530372 RepID=A0A4R5CLG5_9ACTN|nr:anthrone oxygenase family protein [Jiangella asiatica]TDE00776.1 DUF1772 domain-containing protein [Jiangella asiatica]